MPVTHFLVQGEKHYNARQQQNGKLNKKAFMDDNSVKKCFDGLYGYKSDMG